MSSTYKYNNYSYYTFGSSNPNSYKDWKRKLFSEAPTNKSSPEFS